MIRCFVRARVRVRFACLQVWFQFYGVVHEASFLGVGLGLGGAYFHKLTHSTLTHNTQRAIGCSITR